MRNRLAALNASNVPTSWNPNANNTVNALAVSGSSIVYVGGTFTTIGTTQRDPRPHRRDQHERRSRRHRAKPPPGIPKPATRVNALAVSGTSIVYVGGTFANRQHRRDPQPHRGDQDERHGHRHRQSHRPGTRMPTPPSTRWRSRARIVYVGGTFTEIGSTVETRNRLAAIKTNATATATAEATTWNPNATSGVNALAVSGT